MSAETVLILAVAYFFIAAMAMGWLTPSKDGDLIVLAALLWPLSAFLWVGFKLGRKLHGR